MTRLAFTNGLLLALETIRSHKLRAFLTVLGVIVGTGTIIGVGAILTGFDASMAAILRSFGPNSIIVFKFNVGFRVTELTPEERTRKNLTYQNALHIKERCRSVQDVSPMLFSNHGFINAHYKGNDMYDVDLFGVEEAYANGGQADIHVGRFFTDEESRRRAPVVVIGADVEQSLFANIDPVGKIVNVDGHQFEVIGTMQRPAASFFGDQDKRVLLPYWSMQKMFPNAKENAIVVTAREGKLPQALDEIVTVLRIDRHVPYNKPDNFALSTAEQMIADFRQITAMTFLVMVVLSSVGLLVGGIGVMNIMLVSVTERTQEIGLRKAVGAKRADIVIQFLLEASVLTSLGGIAGIIFGWVISVVSRLVFTSLPATVPLWAAALGIIVSVGVGLFFGIWPAYKAARLDPVEALRYE
ncbi:MAG: multidrug ABC transporter substrate-binding protein [Acidobacteria bacterium]|nr:MAG: multidrug ABC transporter substrate-binding protein [Acidobacteriota bacterium]